ncbi:hypothetical protein H4R26_000657 [Coemansia thaxteri]|uniref:Uncharacterized protein n=1 Tax=Coemansia thaxteri TaxID=2663907 RepID=A0A9W8BH92_9FUNG|nr:hypothetical protein H4R26_000657 [Coemansia thaxteri]
MRLTLASVMLGCLVAVVRSDSDFDGFMSSLSYNWQNEFSDLRYQVDQLQKTDPQKYSALAASLGLKPGMQVSVPSQFSPAWASQFVMAAGLYTPPVHTVDTAVPTPTQSLASIDTQATGSVTPTGISISGLMDFTSNSSGNSQAATSGGHASSGGHTSSDGSHHHSDDGTAGLDQSSSQGSPQFGNPVVGNLNTDDAPIIPSGTGYSTSAPKAKGAPHTALLLGLALCNALLLSFYTV